MPRTCTVCRHPRRGEIDRALTEHQPYRRIAAQYGASATALRRHKPHVTARMAQAAAIQETARVETLAREVGRREAKQISQADDLLASVQRLRERLEAALETAAAARDVAALAREARETARLLLEVEGRLRQGTAVQVNVSLGTSPEWLSLQARIVVALAPYPDARAAVLTAIEGATGVSAAPRDARGETPVSVGGSLVGGA